MSEPVIVQLESITKQFNRAAAPAIAQVSLSLQQGEILSLLGPSGCGKTTLLRLVAGFEKPQQGSIEIAGQPVAGNGIWVPPEKRDVGIVFQDYALFPHLSVGDNIAFGLQQSKSISKDSIQKRIQEALALVRLEGLQKRYPHELSGGQQQRVALARALAPQPALILLDEPLSNLDVQVRLQLREEIRRILKDSGTSAIFVTHDQEEALCISDRVGVMQQGKLEQLGSPEAIYTEPATRFVAEFVSQANFIRAHRRGQFWETELGQFPITSPLEGEQADLMIREEAIILQADETGVATIRDRTFLGREHRYRIQTASGEYLNVRTPTSAPLAVGTRVLLSVRDRKVRVFPTNASVSAVNTPVLH
ncbi:ABC transporter ATP-binding protein [Desertifilum sp. FACHB-1129]|uniref:ABC-type quaternary amine transporter n=1 Tax=Desertifilum tharense IPPAS B-1220 TaxID=1781255 RepID=A0A1E5QQZ6_9CYAN|nr:MULTISPECIES: ABC transporter ATP-binding protein [Desertifilum]MDA0210740.1 ABC transporter ATP-binding protein [Cyanobacteria bacterium FC1]MBD2312226.1 ABC transporter ATP-binding protein [Desertifilum sp. FACHB-1129]MBD2323707.1 ABC transporter ATP-binding protein [Desertifilum sp. FACHB-866]MBD2332404.1 ABC transporter ATP-binding protein [Desertifilum sp. FACHB-868]OEJ77088.1 ABC transporter [Desertifilum tharense IPPAS B-1220]